jgi:hypothetical protein
MAGQRVVERLAPVQAGHQDVERDLAGGGRFFHVVAGYRLGLARAQTIPFSALWLPSHL